MAQVQLENEKQREFIRRVVGLPRYGDQFFDYIVEEAFVRMQYALDLSTEEFYEDLQNLSANLNTIRYVNTNERWMGQQIPSMKEIQINWGYFQNLRKNTPPDEYCNKLMETIIHELLHAMQTDRYTGTNRAQVFNHNVNNRGHAIYEICTEAIAAKCTKDRKYSEMEDNKILIGDGYSQELFAVPLLAATFGVSEKTIMKYGVRERRKLIEACNKNIDDMDKTGNLLFRIEDRLERIHSIYYPDDNQTKYKNMSREQKQQEAAEEYKKLIKICEEAMAERIANLPPTYDKAAIVQLKYDQKKIMDTVHEENVRYGNYFGRMDQNEESWIFFSDRNFSYFKSAVESLKELGKPRNRGLMPYAPEIIASIKDGTFSACEKYGLREPREMTVSFVLEAQGFLDDVAHEDYNDFMQWDNSRAFDLIFHGRDYGSYKQTINPDLVLDARSRPDYDQKMRDLKIAVLANKDKYNENPRKKLSELLSFRDGVPPEHYRCYTATVPKYDTFGERISPRERMQRSFRTQEDQVFLADVIVSKFLDKTFEPNGQPIHVEDAEQRKIQEMIIPTMQKYDRAQVKSALRDVILNDSYSRISGEQNRNSMAVLGKKQIADIVMKPLMQELLNERRIIPEKKKDLAYAISVTDQKYPGSGAWRLAAIVSDYQQKRLIDGYKITGEGGARQVFLDRFRSDKDMEDLVGIICDSYSNQNYLMPSNGDPIHQMLNEGGPDYFRENIINTIYHNDYSGLYDSRHKSTIEQLSAYNLIERIAEPFVRESEQARYYEQVAQSRPRRVISREEVSEAARKPNVIQKLRGTWENIKGWFSGKSKSEGYRESEFIIEEGGR